MEAEQKGYYAVACSDPQDGASVYRGDEFLLVTMLVSDDPADHTALAEKVAALLNGAPD